MKKLILILLLIKTFDIKGQDLFFGEKHNKFAYANIKDTVAFIEACYYFKGNYWMHLDTLKYNKGKYTNHNYRLKIKNGNYYLFPGNIKLKKSDVIDTSLYPIRIRAYSMYKWSKFFENYEWGNSIWKENEMMFPDHQSTIPEQAYREIDITIHKYESQRIKSFNQWITTIIITNDKKKSKNEYLNTNDSVIINYIWQQLMDSRIMDKSNILYYQTLAIWFCWGIIEPFAFLYGSFSSYIISYGLYKAENYIADRIRSNKTYIISFYYENNLQLEIKIRNNYILGEMSKFKLKNEFKIMKNTD